MSLIRSLLFIALLAFVPFCFSIDQFRCKAVPGCEIARCDPTPLSWANLERNEFPISCVSDDASKEKVSDDEMNKMKDKMENLASELKRLWNMNELQNEDMRRMRKQLDESIKENEKLQNDLATTQRTVAELQNNTKELNKTNNEVSTKMTKSCQDVKIGDATKKTESGGVFDIYVGEIGKKIEVSCDLTTDGGGWTVFQRRIDGSEDFYRGWDDYVNGFGRKDKEFWLGLENIHQMTKHGKYELRVDLGAFDGKIAYATYRSFSIGSSAGNYRLNVGSYSGTAGDSFRYHNGTPFTTKDKENDEWDDENCAVEFQGAWWYRSCGESSLNGQYHDTFGSGADGVWWLGWKGTEYLKSTEMKFRRVE